MGKKHDNATNRLAKKFGTKHRRKGVDLLAKGSKAIEVAVSDQDIRSSVSQLKRSRAKKRYMAVPAEKVDKAKDLLKGTGFGVMNLKGKIRKRTRNKRRGQ